MKLFWRYLKRYAKGIQIWTLILLDKSHIVGIYSDLSITYRQISLQWFSEAAFRSHPKVAQSGTNFAMKLGDNFTSNLSKNCAENFQWNLFTVFARSTSKNAKKTFLSVLHLQTQKTIPIGVRNYSQISAKIPQKKPRTISKQSCTPLFRGVGEDSSRNCSRNPGNWYRRNILEDFSWHFLL